VRHNATPVKVGVLTFPTEYSIQPDELARLVEEHGFESLFVAEHTHIPASRDTPYPAGGELPKEYSHTYDPFVALTAAAAATSELKLATGICLVVERDPIVTAKEVATLDRVCGGRFMFGVGAGWNREEMESHGTDPRTRFSLMRERVEAMKAIWTSDEASYSGKHVSFERIWQWPKPLQEPHPPVLLGGNGPKVLERVVAFADAWMPNWGLQSTEELIGRVEELQRLASEAGRGPIPVTVYAPRSKPEVLEPLAGAGVERVVLWIPPTPRDEVAPRLERLASLVPRLGGGG
jgi:probable F420-dependent oxidoreductase